MSQSGKIKKLTVSCCAQGDVKTGKAFTSGSAPKGAHVAVAVAETTIKKETTWNGNQLFSDENVIITVRGETLELFKNWTSSVIDNNVREVINNQTFDDVLIIHHADYENNIERRFVEEKYARNIGLISKTMFILDTQCNGNLANCLGIPWEDKAEKGFILHKRIKAHN